MFEDVVVEPALAASQDQLQIGGDVASLFEDSERIHQPVQVLARLDDADGQDERRVTDAKVVSGALELLQDS